MLQAKETVSERVINQVASKTDRDALDLPPLYRSIDPDALDSLVERMSDGSVSFSYAGHRISVESDESISITERSSTADTAPIAESED